MIQGRIWDIRLWNPRHLDLNRFRLLVHPSPSHSYKFDVKLPSTSTGRASHSITFILQLWISVLSYSMWTPVSASYVQHGRKFTVRYSSLLLRSSCRGSSFWTILPHALRQLYTHWKKEFERYCVLFDLFGPYLLVDNLPSLSSPIFLIMFSRSNWGECNSSIGKKSNGRNSELHRH